MTVVVILDNEAVQALASPEHPKHNRVVAFIQVMADRKKKAIPMSAVVPTSVRVEAGWDRTAAAWAFAHQLRVSDAGLDTAHANAATAIRNRIGRHISVVDAHIGAVIQSSTGERITVLTSDPDGITAVAEIRPVNVVRI